MLTLPIDRFFLIDYLIEKVPNWKALPSIYIDSFAYERILNDPYLKQNDSVYSREEVIVEDTGKYYPSLSFSLKQIRFDEWIVEWIEYDGTRQYFTANPIGSLYITYNAA